MSIEIIEASPIEWGLLIDGKGIRTWWKASFTEKPDINTPEVQTAIDMHQRLQIAPYLNQLLRPEQLKDTGDCFLTDAEIFELSLNIIEHLQKKYTITPKPCSA